MIVETRYRDIPWEGARHHCNNRNAKKVWELNRGKPLQIIAPPPPLRVGAMPMCEGPFYPIVGQEESGVCPHIAEIGD